MNTDKENIQNALSALCEMNEKYPLPDWDGLPYLELYMDQVISVLERHLEFYKSTSGKENSVTAAMINNYVKLGTVPAPVKKKYSRIHLAYLLIVFTLKQTLDMATIQKIIPLGLTEEEVKRIYNSFADNRSKTLAYVADNIKSITTPITERDESDPEKLNDILLQIALSANICKILTEKIAGN